MPRPPQSQLSSGLPQPFSEQQDPVILARRPPTGADTGYRLGQHWIDTATAAGYILTQISGTATWVMLGSPGSPLDTINGVVPVANNIDLVNNPAGAGAITVTAIGGGQVGIGVNVDGSTITIVGDQLVATSGGLVSVDTFTGPGTDPVVPIAGGITVTGGQVAAGTISPNVIRTDSLAANTYTIEIQRSSDQAATTIGANGVCHFDSAMFQVDANGFVQLAGGTIAADEFTVDLASGAGVNPVVPDGAGNVNVGGAAVAAVGVPVQTHTTAANTYNLEVQRTATSTGTDATSQGLASFDDTQFTADANGYVQLLGVASGTAQTIGAVTADVITFPMGTTAGARSFDVTVAGFEATGPSCIAYSIIACVRITAGGVATVGVGAIDITTAEEAALSAASVTVTDDGAGGNAIVQVTGVAGLTIEWSATLQSTFAS